MRNKISYISYRKQAAHIHNFIHFPAEWILKISYSLLNKCSFFASNVVVTHDSGVEVPFYYVRSLFAFEYIKHSKNGRSARRHRWLTNLC